MEKITLDQYQSLIQDAHILEQDQFGLKVVETNDQRIIKLFRLKRFFSSALFKPYAVRFAENATKLEELGIPALKIERLIYCPAEKRYLVIYPKLPGAEVRRLFENSTPDNLAEPLAIFFAKLHHLGIYFRSLHLGNVLLQPNGQFALIDFADTKFFGRPLSANHRARNFHHLLRYPSDKKAIESLGMTTFFNHYCRHAGLQNRHLEKFREQHKKINQINFAF